MEEIVWTILALVLRLDGEVKDYWLYLIPLQALESAHSCQSPPKAVRSAVLRDILLKATLTNRLLGIAQCF